jgi:mRNA interferase MazF
MTDPLWPGRVVWVDLGPPQGDDRQQRGRRPALVVSSADHLSVADHLVIVLPATSRDRGWPNHVRLTGPIELAGDGFAMTEQIRTIDRRRIAATAGEVDEGCLSEIMAWVERWLGLPTQRSPRRR